jgi:hypothetical protein
MTLPNGTYTPIAPEYEPSLGEWVSVILSGLLLVGVFYLTESYLFYREATSPARLPAARILADLQEAPASQVDVAHPTVSSRLQLNNGDDVSTYVAELPDYAADRAPNIRMCGQDCSNGSNWIDMALAYGLHYDRSGGADNWDFWFAPSAHGKWLADPVRFLYRVNPSQGDHWGFVNGSWTDLDVDFSENKIAGVDDVGQSPLADYLHQIVETQNIGDVNFIEAPLDSLTIHSDFGERALLFKLPGWQSIGGRLEDIRAGLPGFLSEVSSGKTLGQWIGDNWGDLLWLLSLLVIGLFYAIKGWWAVIVYSFFLFIDDLEEKRLNGAS